MAKPTQRPRWSPDSKRIAYISDRGGSSQIWLMDPDGGNAKQVTNLSTEADGHIFSPDGKNLVFTSSVYPECGADDACNKKLLDAEKASKVKARIYTELLYRHWTGWQGKRRSHLLVDAGGGRRRPRTSRRARATCRRFRWAAATTTTSRPTARRSATRMNADPVPATSTNSDLYVVSIAGGQSRQDHHHPGRRCRVRAIRRTESTSRGARSCAPGYESDRWRLMVLERATGKVTNLTENLDRWVNSFTWSPDSAQHLLHDQRSRPPGHPGDSGGRRRRRSIAASGDSELDDMQLTRNGKTMVYTQQSGVSPVEIYRASSGGGAPVALTHLNDQALADYQMTPLEEFWVDGADGAKVQSFLVKPPNFTAGAEVSGADADPRRAAGILGTRAGPIAGTRRCSPRRDTWW